MKIEKLKLVDEGSSTMTPDGYELMHKLNEIIDHLNNQGENKSESTPISNHECSTKLTGINNYNGEDYSKGACLTCGKLIN